MNAIFLIDTLQYNEAIYAINNKGAHYILLLCDPFRYALHSGDVPFCTNSNIVLLFFYSSCSFASAVLSTNNCRKNDVPEPATKIEALLLRKKGVSPAFIIACTLLL